MKNTRIVTLDCLFLELLGIALWSGNNKFCYLTQGFSYLSQGQGPVEFGKLPFEPSKLRKFRFGLKELDLHFKLSDLKP